MNHISNIPTPPQVTSTQANALLLQGPVGPFFARISRDLRERGFGVWKINFNGGDRIFYPLSDAYDYTGTVENWELYLERFILNKSITRLYLFGDCRTYHRMAKSVARKLGIRVFVFEEGYIRPNFITLEEDGVNGNSSLMGRQLEIGGPLEKIDEAAAIRFGFLISAGYSMLYYWACAFYARRFRHYKHHRPIGWISEGVLWLRSAFRKIIYRQRDRLVYQDMMSQFDGEYFLCPLQVHCDMQVLVHSEYNSIEHFIGEVLVSFVRHAPSDKAIIFKHHPLDRGYADYTRLISNLVGELGLHGRVFYVHDICLPSLIKNARGSVMINSTVGMSSLFHGTPVKVLGDAIYNKAGLTSQVDLDEFWVNPGEVKASVFERFRSYLITNNQLNGSLYVKLTKTGYAGINWSNKLTAEHSADADRQQNPATGPTLRLVGGIDVSCNMAVSGEPGQENPKKAA